MMLTDHLMNTAAVQVMMADDHMAVALSSTTASTATNVVLHGQGWKRVHQHDSQFDDHT